MSLNPLVIEIPLKSLSPPPMIDWNELNNKI